MHRRRLFHSVLANAMLIAVAGMGALACVAEVKSDDEDLIEEHTGEAVQALPGSGYRVRISYYSDSSYTTKVGGFSTGCNGGKSTWGTTTQFAVGYLVECYEPFLTYGCYQSYCDANDFCWQECPSAYSQCFNC